MSYLLAISNILLFLVSTGFVLNILKSGGSLGGEQIYSAGYNGLLNYFPWIWLSLTSVVILLNVKFVVNRFYGSRSLIFLPLFFSVFAAADSDEFFTVTRVSFQIFLAIVLIHLSVCFFGIKKYLSGLKNLSYFAALISIMVSIFAPSYGTSADLNGVIHWQGGFDQKNTMGNYFALVFCIFFPIYWLKILKVNQIFFLVLLFLIFMSGSTTSFVMVISSVVLTFLGSLWTGGVAAKKIISIVIVLLFYSFACLMIYFSVGDYNTEIFGKDSSFSGRNLIWRYVLLLVDDKLFLGYGIDHLSASIIRNERFFESEVGFIVMTSHNGYLEALYSVGLIGSAVFFMYICRSLVLLSNYKIWIFPLSLVFSYLVLNLMEARLIGFNVYFFSIVLLDCLSDYSFEDK